MKRRTLWQAGLLCCWFLMSHVAFADNDTDSVHCAVYSEAPWYFGADSERQSVSSYYSDMFAKASGYDIVLHPMPYKRSIRSVLSDRIDFVIALSSPELEEYAVPYVQIGRIAVVIYSHQPIDTVYESPVEDVNIALVSGLEGNPDIQLPDWNYVTINSEASGLRAVAKRRLDATVMSRNAYEFLVAEEPELAKGHVQDIGFANIYAWVSKEDAGREAFKDVKAVIEKHAFGGKLVFDWFTANISPAPASL